MRIRIAIILLLVTGGGNARAFDCTKATVAAEFVICSDPGLTAIADQRRRAWDEALARVDGEQKATLLADQRRWLKDYPQSCGLAAQGEPPTPIGSEVVACFKRASEARTAYLRAYPPAAADKAPAGSAALPGTYHVKFTFACRTRAKLAEVLRSLARHDYASPLREPDCLPIPEGSDIILLSVQRNVAKIRLCSEEAGCTDVYADATSVIGADGQSTAR